MKEPDIIIRRAGEEDIGAMASLLEELFAVETDFILDRERQTNGLLLLYGNPDAVVIVAEITGRVIGMCTVQKAASTAEGGWSGLLEDLIVTEECRRMGIGSKLLGAAVRWAGNNNLSRLQLLADKRNTSAITFYRRFGWETTNMVSLHYHFTHLSR